MLEPKRLFTEIGGNDSAMTRNASCQRVRPRDRSLSLHDLHRALTEPNDTRINCYLNIQLKAEEQFDSPLSGYRYDAHETSLSRAASSLFPSPIRYSCSEMEGMKSCKGFGRCDLGDEL